MILTLELLISLALLDYFCLSGPLSSSFCLHFIFNTAFYRHLPRVSHATLNISSFFHTSFFPPLSGGCSHSFPFPATQWTKSLCFLPHVLQWLFMTNPELKKIRCNPYKLADLLSVVLGTPRGIVCEPVQPNKKSARFWILMASEEAEFTWAIVSSECSCFSVQVNLSIHTSRTYVGAVQQLCSESSQQLRITEDRVK